MLYMIKTVEELPKVDNSYLWNYLTRMQSLDRTSVFTDEDIARLFDLMAKKAKSTLGVELNQTHFEKFKTNLFKVIDVDNFDKFEQKINQLGFNVKLIPQDHMIIIYQLDPDYDLIRIVPSWNVEQGVKVFTTIAFDDFDEYDQERLFEIIEHSKLYFLENFDW